MRLGQAVAFLAERTGLRARLQDLWRRDIARSVAVSDRHTGRSVVKLKRLADEGRQVQRTSAVKMRELEGRLAASMDVIQALESRLTRLERTALADSRQARRVAEWQARFSSGAIRAHVRRAVSEALLREEPAAHLLVEGVLPPDLFELVLDTLPDRDRLMTSDEARLNPAELDAVPRLTALVWECIDTDVADAIARAALERLRPFLELRYARLFGRERVETVLALPHQPSGRLLRWPSGHDERPHLDPKGTSVTILICLGRPADPAPAVSLYSVDRDFAPVHTDTAYPDAHGVACTLVSRVPCRPNAALVLVNGGATHRVEVPEDGGRGGSALYAVELQIGPDPRQLVDLVSTMPPVAQQHWLGLAGSLAT